MATIPFPKTIGAADTTDQRRHRRAVLWVGLVGGSGPLWWRLLRWSQRNQA